MAKMPEKSRPPQLSPEEMGQVFRIYNLALEAAEAWDRGIWFDRDRTHVQLDHLMYEILTLTRGRPHTPETPED